MYVYIVQKFMRDANFWDGKRDRQIVTNSNPPYLFLTRVVAQITSPSLFVLFLKKIAFKTGSNSNFKFCCDHLDTIIG